MSKSFFTEGQLWTHEEAEILKETIDRIKKNLSSDLQRVYNIKKIFVLSFTVRKKMFTSVL